MKNSSRRVKRRFIIQLFLLRMFYRITGRLFPGFAGRRAFELWFTSPKFKTPSYERQAEQSAQHDSIRINGLDVAVYIWQRENTQAGKSLLFIHGWSGRGTQVVGFLEPLLDKGYRIISFDAPAHGKTAGKQTSIMEFTDTLLALQQRYGRFDAVISHSFGGMVLSYALNHGFETSRAVCICPPDTLECLLEGFQQTLTLPEPAMQVMVRKSFAAYGQITRDAVNMTRNTRHLQCPVLILHDEDDNDVPVDSSRRIVAAWPESKLILTKGLGHRRILRAEQVVQKVVDYLSVK